MILSVFGLEERQHQTLNAGRRKGETYLISRNDAICFHFSHLINNGLRTFQDVSVYGGTKGQKFFLGITVLMYDLHLLHDRQLARLARTWNR
jgi:hypothetical protein